MKYSDKDLLKKIGYTSFEIDAAISALNQNNHTNQDPLYGRDRPKTHVFTQGKVFTYEKLEVPKKIERSKKPIQGNVNEGSAVEMNDDDDVVNMSVTGFSPKAGISVQDQVYHPNQNILTMLKKIRTSNLNNVNIWTTEHKFYKK